jgi:hypothetical protein
MLDSFDVFPEYSKPLGRPLGPPTNASTPTPPLLPWQPLQDQNLVDSWPSAPSAAGSIPGQLAFLGLQPTFAACLALARGNASFTAVTWAGSATAQEWQLTCWGRLDSVDWGACLWGEVEGAPCHAAVSAGAVSAVRDSVPGRPETVWRRSFEHVNVSWWPGNGSAVMEGW